MANLPIILPVGMISIYGTGTAVSNNGLYNLNENGKIRWGTVNEVWTGGSPFLNAGDKVMFNDDDVFMRLMYYNYPYVLVPAQLAIKQADLVLP